MYRYINATSRQVTWIYPEGSPLWAHGKYIGDTDRAIATTATSKASGCNNIRHKLKDVYGLSVHPSIDSSKVVPRSRPASSSVKHTVPLVDDQIKMQI